MPNDQAFLTALQWYVRAAIKKEDIHGAETNLINALNRIIDEKIDKALAGSSIRM